MASDGGGGGGGGETDPTQAIFVTGWVCDYDQTVEMGQALLASKQNKLNEAKFS